MTVDDALQRTRENHATPAVDESRTPGACERSDRAMRPVPAALVGAVFVIAVVTGLPSLRGGFLAGDDYHLVLNHVLVNHPSLAHAFELLTIVHRDLYQPIPLLSFSLDFAVTNGLGLLPTNEGPHAGAWVFHLSNVLIHAINAVLVFFIIRRFAGKLPVAAAAALLFAVHPLASEPVAWVSGRMMLLSVGFTLGAVVTFERWNERPTTLRGILVILCTLLAHMSKVSVALPVLVAVGTLARKETPPRRWWAMWIAVTVISGFFTLFNISASEEMFDIADAAMKGPKVLYCLLALEQYFRLFLVPVGLSIWYPPPADLTWTQPAVLSAYATVGLVAVLTVISIRYTRVGLLGMLWFMSSIFPTLPIVPARRAVGADRYVYLPMIGLAWIVAALLVHWYHRVRRRAGATSGRPLVAPRLLIVPAAVVVVVFIGIAWKTHGYRVDDIAASVRNIQTNADYPGVYKQAAWAYYRHGRYQEAIDIAAEDLARYPDDMACEVYQVTGMSQFRLGRYDEALASLYRAIEADPKYGKCYSRLAQIQAHLGRHDDAIANYERAVEIMPFYNPALLPLADLYRTVGRLDDAVRTYQTVLENNPYDVTAQLTLAEIDIQQNRFAEAVERLTRLLDWMPENAVARTNLGVAYQAMGKLPEAVDAFTDALLYDSRNATAAINLANLYVRQNRPRDAERLYEAQMPYHVTDLGFLIAYHDFALTVDRPDLTAAAFIHAYNRTPTDVGLRVWTAYTLAQAGDFDRAAQLLAQVPSTAPPAVPLLTRVLLALHRGEDEAAIGATDALLAAASPTPADAVARLTADLRRVSAGHPEDPWPYFVMAKILFSQGDPALADLALVEFRKRCPTPQCAARADAIRPPSPGAEPDKPRARDDSDHDASEKL